jgi:hypothetical protein
VASGLLVHTAASHRAEVIADRLALGAETLALFARSFTDREWEMRLPQDGRKIGVVVHHVASAYPLQIHLAREIAAGRAVTGVTPQHIDLMNAVHARDHDTVTKEATLALLRRNSLDAEAAIRVMTDEELDRAAPVSLHGDAPLTCQFVLEAHAVRHSFHHLSRIRAALRR